MKKITLFKRILIAKTSHLGDLVISLPMAASLKQHFPDCKVLFLTHPRTLDVAVRCLDVDAAYALPDKFADLVGLLVSLQIDVFIQANTSEKLARAAKKARIPVRIGSSFRWYNWLLCSHRVAITRCHKQLNKRLLDLEYLRPLGIAGVAIEDLPALYRFSKADLSALFTHLGLAPDKRRIILHASSITAKSHQWPLAKYQALMRSFDKASYQWIITGTAQDKDYLKDLLTEDDNVDKVDTVGLLSLNELLTLMQGCDGLVASSTGPAHLAAALGINTLGLYQSDPVVFKRWAVVGRAVRLLKSTTPCLGNKSEYNCLCVQHIDLSEVCLTISAWFEESVGTPTT
ncbi:MAG: glycosyltransferase family 9 protein [Methylococcaceae bacterium]|jgi:ADP-heptose:LPS heptosyltransferase